LPEGNGKLLAVEISWGVNDEAGIFRRLQTAIHEYDVVVVQQVEDNFLSPCAIGVQ
jgi:hypothetical protein